MIKPQVVQIQANLSYDEQPVQILSREVKKLRNKEITLVKVLWENHRVEEATREPEEEIRIKYPALFWLSVAKHFKGDGGYNAHFLVIQIYQFYEFIYDWVILLYDMIILVL